LYNTLLKTFPSDEFGYGHDLGPEPTDDKYHWPMVYALIASAEAQRAYNTNADEAAENATTAADWLYRNRDINDNDIVGWGLPVDWDAGANGDVTPGHTEDAIYTALAGHGICNLFDINQQHTGNADTKKIKSVRESLMPYLKNCYNSYDTGRCFWYTVRQADDFDVLNSSAMLAGLFQRVAQYDCIDQSKQLEKAADEAVSYILNCSTVGPADSRHWLYYGDKLPREDSRNPVNDIIHHAYILDGLFTYRDYGGRKVSEFPQEAIERSLWDFTHTEQTRLGLRLSPVVSEFPNSLKVARIWGEGYFAYVLARHFSLPELLKQVSHSLLRYTKKQISPRETPEKNGRGSLRHNAHLLRGLGEIIYGNEDTPTQGV
jgi:hypothetical protein